MDVYPVPFCMGRKVRTAKSRVVRESGQSKDLVRATVTIRVAPDETAKFMGAFYVKVYPEHNEGQSSLLQS